MMYELSNNQASFQAVLWAAQTCCIGLWQRYAAQPSYRSYFKYAFPSIRMTGSLCDLLPLITHSFINMEFYIRPTWPFTSKELHDWYGLAVTVEHDVVRLWLVRSIEHWESTHRDSTNEVGIRWTFWQAKVSFFMFF